MNVRANTEEIWEFILKVIESVNTCEQVESCNDWLLDLKKKKVIDYLQWKDANHINQITLH